MSETVSIDLESGKGRIEGVCNSQFQPVLDEFVNNFERRGEVGASVAVTHEGETVVDLWGGLAAPDTQAPWRRDTVSLVYSSTKGITALIANVLIDRGLLDPYQPVAEIWPEFATNGKDKATVRMMLDHTVGVPVLRETVKPGGFFDWDYMCDLLARQAPYWEPGSNQGYHGVTYGWTAGELIRRVSGKSVGANIQEILSGPLGLDLWCGLPEEIEPRVAPMIYADAEEQKNDMYELAMADPDSIPGRFLLNDGGWLSGVVGSGSEVEEIGSNSRASHAAEIPAANGITNARGLAGAYQPFALGGSVDGRTFVGADTLVGMEEISAATNRDETLRVPAAWSLGFGKREDLRKRRSDPPLGVILGRRAFGHAGAGGSVGFAEPEAGMSFGYTMNKMGATLALTDRAQSLVDATYRTLGYHSNSSGSWTRS